jgi:EAL domain-containing protein (putative c-di-GMP-specific phosphodiesterase class I)
LQHAVARNQLFLHYQPKVDLSSAATHVTGVEALVRWMHPELGMVPPDQFIGLAEQHGYIDTLTHWVLEAALRQCQAWHELGFQIDVSVNVSLRSLGDSHLPGLIAALLQRYGVAPQYLILEITESALMLDQERTLAALGQLAKLGVRLSIDDFGTGYASLGYLRRMPLSEVKIDRSFVSAMSTNEQDQAIVESVITLGHKLGLKVVSEGVENHRTLTLLGSLGCDQAQGYYFTPPLPAAEFKQWHDRSIWGTQQVLSKYERRRQLTGRL